MTHAVNPRLAKSWGEFAQRTYLPGRDPRPNTPGNAAALKSSRALTRAEYLALQEPAPLPADRVHLIKTTLGDNPPSPAPVGRDSTSSGPRFGTTAEKGASAAHSSSSPPEDEAAS